MLIEIKSDFPQVWAVWLNVKWNFRLMFIQKILTLSRMKQSSIEKGSAVLEQKILVD